MKKIFRSAFPLCFFAGLLFSATAVFAQPLSDSAQISLMTVAPGGEVYSIFGHSAIRIFDPKTRLDRCYNYGTFEFDQPNFLLKFCRGKLLYYLNPEPTRAFEVMNLQDRRAMQEQVFNLNSAQKQRFYELLETNAREENRYYKYDFFYDNCATRIRDVVKETFFHQLWLDSSRVQAGVTMRQLLQPYLREHRWTGFGIDLVLGQPCDRRASVEHFMFLPDNMRDVFAGTKMDDSTQLVHSLRAIPPAGFPKATLKPQDPVDRFFSEPLWVMCFVALLGLLSMANPRTERLFDFLFWFFLGVAGLIIALLWFATDHQATKQNWNILWALPTHLLFFWRNRRTEWTENYFTGAAILAALALLFWKWCPQAMPIAAIPIAILVVIKGLWRRNWKQETV